MKTKMSVNKILTNQIIILYKLIPTMLFNYLTNTHTENFTNKNVSFSLGKKKKRRIGNWLYKEPQMTNRNKKLNTRTHTQTHV